MVTTFWGKGIHDYRLHTIDVPRMLDAEAIFLPVPRCHVRTVAQGVHKLEATPALRRAKTGRRFGRREGFGDCSREDRVGLPQKPFEHNQRKNNFPPGTWEPFFGLGGEEKYSSLRTLICSPRYSHHTAAAPQNDPKYLICCYISFSFLTLGSKGQNTRAPPCARPARRVTRRRWKERERNEGREQLLRQKPTLGVGEQNNTFTHERSAQVYCTIKRNLPHGDHWPNISS